MDAVGIKLEVRNAGIGGMGPWPSTFCLQSLVGEEVDLMTREWEYWPYDAGINKKGVSAAGYQSDVAAFEMFLRYAGSISGNPVIYVLDMAHEKRVGELSRGAMMLAQNVMNPEGTLSAYSKMAVNEMSHFGKPFDHLRLKAVKKGRWEKGQRPSKRECNPNDVQIVNNCPVNYDKQDGHHTRAAYLGFDEEEHPDWAKKWPTRFKEDYRDLFVNWHPAVLGHEVMGNQLAYHLAGVLIKALKLLAGDADIKSLKGMSTAVPLPDHVACTATWCAHKFTCALGHEPAYQKGRIDSFVEETEDESNKWTLTNLDGQPTKPTEEDIADRCENPMDEECIRAIKGNSYIDMKMGMRGGVNDGLVTFRLSHNSMEQCLVLLEEPPVGWNKPANLANWFYEVEFTVNGKPCGDACNVFIAEGSNSMMVDLRKIMGSKCRRQDTLLGVRVKRNPEAVATAEAPCRPRGANGCETTAKWAGYVDSICSSDCKSVKQADRKDLRTFISQIAFS